MYESHFGLSERPFSIAPDPRYVYLSQAHEDALAHLLYGVGEGGGFVQLTGEVGTGKTTLIRSLVDQLPANVDLALIFNPRLSPRELVATVCDELHIPYPEGASLKDLIDRLNERLLASFAAGRRIVLIIDEAQALDPDVLEQVRLLTNLETTREKLLQIVLVGQPELRDALARPELRQLAQRITARYHLEPLSIEDTRNYVLHRLNVAGAKRPLFSDPAIREIQRSSGGVPRLTNVIADRSLLGAYTRGREQVDRGLVREAAREVQGRETGPGPRWALALVPGLLALGLAGGGWWLWRGGSGPAADPPEEAVIARAAVKPPPADAVPSRTDPAPAAAVPDVSTGGAPAGAAEATPPGAESPPQAPGFEPWLEGNAARADSASALSALFGSWGRAYQPADRPACQVAREQGLRCLLDQGNWTTLARLDRPAVLDLRDAGSRKRQLTLVGLDGERVSFRVGGETLSFPRSGVEPFWFGDFLILWAPPEGLGAGLIRPGDSGPAVLWLRERLAEVHGEAPAAVGDPKVYDDTLVREVLRFQGERRLARDGIVGERTLIQLNSAPPPRPGPRLSGGGS
jgi:general secretion pathway protein A